MAWSPLELAPAQRRQLEGVIEKLAPQVVARSDEAEAFGLIEGKVGMGFACYELAAAGVPNADEAAMRALVGAVEMFNSSGAYPSLHTGIAGLGWLVDAWVGDEDLCGPIDDSLRERVEAMTEPEPLISLRAGLAGIGLYAARRAPRAASARALLESVSARLASSVHREPNGIVWNTPQQYLLDRDGARLFAPWPNTIREWGAAHGVAPVALLLGALEAQKVPGAPETTQALEWIWASAPPQPNRFGYAWGDGQLGVLNIGSWCTGDPGVALPCWLAARSVNAVTLEAVWLGFGRELASRIVAGERFGAEKRIDLCCGLSGVLAIFSSWASASGDPVLADAARALLTRLLDELAAADVEAMSVGLQFGLAGIVLALMAQLATKAPAWAAPFALTSPL